MNGYVREYGSEYDWMANDSFLMPEIKERGAWPDAKLYRSGRDALKAAAKACKGRYSRVLLPALCCESMVSPFQMYGIEPVFYRLHWDYTADLFDVEEKLTEDSILLYCGYFGISPFEDAYLQRLRETRPGICFLEDRTQDILAERMSEFTPDLTVASIRKWTAIPDGGLLWSKSITCGPGTEDKEFAQLRIRAMQQKSRYLRTGDLLLKDQFRNLLGTASELLDISIEPIAMTQEATDLMSQLDLESMFSCRQENVRMLQELLLPMVEQGAICFVSDRPERSTLYFPVLVEDQKWFQTELAKVGIYCPVIWPVPEEARGICPVAEYTAEHMLGIPCDHRYSQADMAYIGGQIVRLCHEE